MTSTSSIRRELRARPTADREAVARGSRRTVILVAMCLTVLMVQLDTTVVNLALHNIQQQLRAPIALLQWIVDGYNLIYATCILSGGALGDLYGRRRLFLIGTTIFTVALLLCGFASSPLGVIAWRAVAGLGAALALPGSLSILRVTYTDARERTRAVSLWAGVNGVAIAIGPTVGGVLIQAFGWRSVFWAVVPIGALAWVLARASVHESSDPRGRHLDLPAQVLAIVCLGSLALACIQGAAWGWRSPWIIGAFATALATGVAFIAWEWRTHDPLLPLDVFRGRSLSASLAIATLMTFGMYALLFIFPLYLQDIRHHSPLRAGVELLPMGLSFAIVSPFTGRIASGLGPRVLIAAGMALSAAGLIVFATASAETPIALLLAGMVIVGVALGLETGPLMAVAVAGLGADRSGLASALINVARIVGATLGVAILGSVFASHAAGAGGPAFLLGMHHAMTGATIAEATGALIAWIFVSRSALGTNDSST